ncbi:RNA recognition motif domain [Macleaya cordata]|uniref:RNA recognition motif domain n=1 Tax=Macleaya cordata TaxID=56857 RepID=A0A200PP43_MACCD|nr:RNA recognition motif domain [Macleaya cordata]
MVMASLDEETTKKVIRQVEFYFSDSNLPRDEFLKKSISESEDGLLSLALICSFSRMRSHLGLGGDVKPEDISEETVKAVAETLKKSTFLKVSEDGTKIGRRTELPKPEVVEQIDIRTIAASPLQHDVTRDELETFFAQYGKVNSVRLPRHVADKRFFCGTGLIEFSTEEDAENVLKQSLSYAGTELELKPKKDYDAEREEMSVEFEKTRSSRESYNKNSTNSETDYPKGLIVAFKLKHILEGGSAEHNVTPEEINQKASENLEDGNKESSVMETEDEKITGEGEEKLTEDAADESIEKSSEDCNQKSEETTTVGGRPSAPVSRDNKDIVLREDIKSAFHTFGTIKYVDYTMGAESGYIRFEEPEGAQKARAAAVLVDGGLIVKKNYSASLEAVTGDAEREYWSLLRGSREKRREGKGGNHGRGGRNFRGRRGNDSPGGRPNKAQKVAAA